MRKYGSLWTAPNIVWSKSKHKMTNDVFTKKYFNMKIAVSIFDKMSNANSLSFEFGVKMTMQKIDIY